MKKLLVVLILVLSIGKIFAADFITRWNLNNPGIAPAALTFAVGTTGIVNYTWESIPSGTSGSGSFSGSVANITGLPAGAVIRLHIEPTNFNRFFLNIGPNIDCYRLIDVEQWGSVKWQSMENAFSVCTYLDISASDVPDLSVVTSCRAMFNECSKLTGPSNINTWDVSKIEDMSSMFRAAALFNQPVVDWDISNVKDLSSIFEQALIFNQPIDDWNVANVKAIKSMFSGAKAFNQPLSSWDISKFTNLNYMFYGASSFNQPLDNWDVSNVKEMKFTLAAYSFNQPLSNWDVSNVETMEGMFYNATKFNQAIAHWNISKVKDMSWMFFNAISFVQPIVSWDVSSVTNMNNMFAYSSFNQAIENWDVSNVTNMNSMFHDCPIFNRPIGNWDVSNVTDMGRMFAGCSAFNQPLSNWDVSNVTRMAQMFSRCTSFNQPIGNWDVSNVEEMYGMFEIAKAFNQPIGDWNVSSVLSMLGMFQDAQSFNQPTGNWNMAKLRDASWMLNGSGLDCANYSATLFGWFINPNCPSGINLGAYLLEYGLNVKSIRNDFYSKKKWIISGDHAGAGTCCFLQNTALYQDTCGSFLYRGQTLTNGGFYRDTLVNSWGCDSLITLNLKIYDSPNSLVVYPNPASTHLNINTVMACEKVENAKKELYNSMGQLVFTTKEDVIDVSVYQKGIYFLKYLHYVVKVLVQ